MKSLRGICMNSQFFLVHIFSHMGYQLDKKTRIRTFLRNEYYRQFVFMFNVAFNSVLFKLFYLNSEIFMEIHNAFKFI